MSENPPPKARRTLFRAIALEHYRGPIEVDTPHTLPPWYPGLLIAAFIVAISIAFLWL